MSSRVSITQFPYISAEITCIDLGVSTCNGLEDGIMDKDVLFLLHQKACIRYSEMTVHNTTHRTLDHLHSLSTEVGDDACYIHHAPFPSLAGPEHSQW